MKKTLVALMLALFAAAPLSAQMGGMDHGASLTGVRGLYEMVRGYITASAEQMPEENYSFKPTPDVRSFGELVGHVTNSSYMFCAPVLGEQPPQMPDAEKITSKAELVSALKAAFAYCDKAYAVDAAKADASLSFFNQPQTGLSVLAFNMGHDFEHYGNMVTYFRLKGMVPPSSQRSGM